MESSRLGDFERLRLGDFERLRLGDFGILGFKSSGSNGQLRYINEHAIWSERLLVGHASKIRMITTSSYRKYAILILAAGNSSRLGRPKQLVKINSKTLLGHTIDAAAHIDQADLHVVLGSSSEHISKELNPRYPTHTNPNWEKGMGHSIGFGVSQLMTQNYQAVILSVCDQPYIEAKHFQQLIEVYEQNAAFSIVVSKYGNGNGPPSLFDRTHFEQLIELNGEEGAKEIVHANKNKVGHIHFKKGDFDVDTEEDVRLLT